MLKAIGASAKRLPGGDIQIGVRIVTDDGRPVATATFIGPSLVDIRRQVQQALVARRDAERDAALAQAVIDVELGSV